LAAGSGIVEKRIAMLVNQTSGQPIASRVVRCDTFWRKMRGLMFRPPLASDEAYLFVGRRESVTEAAIHMFFVFFPIAVLWLDSEKRVVDVALARPFRPYYAPAARAQYYCECVPGVLDQVAVGDQLVF
jgi:uncharacterized membrane protein (UPF0127 family)